MSLGKRFAQLWRAAWGVSVDPEVRGGEAVVRGTRVSVTCWADLVKQGASREELLEAALLYARLHPRRGEAEARALALVILFL